MAMNLEMSERCNSKFDACQINVIVRLAMTERCQNKLTGENRNQNLIICGGILVALLAILYFYRFHLVTIVVSYGLGCVACYYGLSTNILQKYVELITCHFIKETPEAENTPSKSCNTCGVEECNRHDPEISAEPWSGLLVHKQLDQAIEDFYNTILEQFINSWYSKITLQPFFVDELRHQLRYASACLLKRALKINYARLITERLVPCALRHYTIVTSECRPSLHVAVSSRDAEMRYLRCVTDALLPYLLRNAETQNSVFKVLIREIFAGWVLLSLTDVLADPYILNMLIILATSDETMAQLPATPNYKVEFLETFVRQTESVYAKRPRLLRIELELLVNEQEHFYAFMQHLKGNGSIHVLQFYKDIKSFQARILNPDISSEEKSRLRALAAELRRRYPAAPTALRRDLAEVKAPDWLLKLQTSRALYQAARESHATLEKVLMPKFLHSEEFYKILIGPRIPTGYNKQLTKRPQEKPSQKLGTRLRNVLKSQVDGQIESSDTDDGVENVDILKYLDSLAAEDTLGDQDLSTYKVVLTNVETRLQAPPRRGPVRVFTLAVHRAAAGSTPSFWNVLRTEHDFHLLRAKLLEFHGERLLAHLPLPSRRDNSPLETLRYKYEDFLQRILQISLLQTSELLYLFLTVDSDFSLVVQASTLNVNTDLGNIYQSVAHKLRKEKGQHLESFLRNFLVSSDKERYQALKQGTTREVEEALELCEKVPEVSERRENARNIRDGVFGNNWDVPPSRTAELQYQTHVTGFVQCFMFILLKIVQPPAIVTAVLGSILSLARRFADDVFNTRLNAWLSSLLTERRLAHLIRLGQGVIFGKKSAPRMNYARQRELCRSRLQRVVRIVPPATGAVLTAFEALQNPQLNKQLVYNLLDLCLLELFPELRPEANS